MAQYKSFGLLWFTIYFLACQVSGDVNVEKFEELSQFVLKSFNAKTNSVYVYKSAQVIDGYPLNDSNSAYHLQLDFSVGCNSQSVSETDCFPKSLICEVTITEDPENGERKLVDDDTKCNLPPRKEHIEEPSPENTGPESMEKQEEELKAMFDDLGPFLMKHLDPITEETLSPVGEEPVEEEPVDVDERMIRGEETPVEKPVVKEPIIEAPILKKQVYCTGCVIDINADLPALEEFVEQALTMIDQTSNNLYKHNIVRIAKAQKQVVSGVKYILTLEVAETYCLKSSGQERETCESNSGPSRICLVEFLDKPWLNIREIISNNCTQDNNDLDNEIVPRFALHSESGRQSIIDYLDSMDAPVADMDVVEPDAEELPEVTEGGMKNSFAEAEKVDGSKSLEEEEDKVSPDDRVQVNKEQEASEETSEESEEATPQVAGDFVGGVYRKKREVLSANRFGGLRDIGESEKKLVHDLAELAVHTLDEIDADDSRRVVLEIVDAKKQLVDGVMYHLKIRVASTSCSENGAAKEGCLEDLLSTPKICNIQMHRSFAADSPNDVKVVKSECTNEAGSRHHRTGRSSPVGSYSPANISDPYIQNVTSFAVAEFDKSSNSMFRQSLVRIVEARQQVVEGYNVHLTLELGDSTCRKSEAQNGPCLRADEGADTVTCHIVVWDRPWLNMRVVTSSSCGDSAPRTKRSTNHLVGGPSPVDLADPTLQTMAKFSLAHLDGMSNALYAQKVVKILHATQQVVQGIKYKITLETGYTSCRKGQGIDVDSCGLKDDSNNQICVVEVWDRPWLKDRRVVSAKCTPSPSPSPSPSASVKMTKRSTIGGGSHDIHLGLFRDFMAEHGKVYNTPQEMKRRFHIFRANMKKIKTLQETEQGTAKYGATKFADLTSKEFKKMYLGLNPKLKAKDSVELPQAKIPQITLPSEYDWRNYNVVTPVKNQGMCGSCWAFSVTGNVEGQWALRRGQLLSLSEQELVDCDKLDNGCEGGMPSNAYDAISTIGGLESEADYPYDGADEKCHFNKTEVKATVTGGVNITTNETQIAQWLVKNGPISIGINANAMQFYYGGVSHPWKMLCNPADLDHGVLIVGYGVHKTSIRHKILPYWIVKNSWGPSWGEKGYYRVYRGDGTCGVNLMATSAVVG